jgi:DNA-binding CsgD family transcriptional regulator
LGGAALLERDDELETLAATLDAARAGTGRLTVVEGHAGIGKSQLLAAARGFARGTGLRVLSATAGELERDFAFGVALQLLEPPLATAKPAERDRLLAGAGALAAPLFDGGTVPGADGGEDDVFPLLHGLYWVVSNLAEGGPLLLTVDDAHWADAPSLRFLLYLAQRLAALPVALVVARRPGEPGAEDELLARLSGHHAAAHVDLEPLGEPSVARLVAAAFGAQEDPEFAAACAEVTGGNPLLVNQLLAALAAEGTRPGPEAARRVRELGPEEVSRSVLLRLSGLQLGATSLARSIAVLGDATPLRRAAELAGLEPGLAGEAADALAAAEILRPGEPLSFVHPIVRSAIYAELPAAERARAHVAAARALRAEAAPPELVAGHLLKAEPRGETWVVEVLEDAAERALAAGAPRSAVRYLRRALAEPPARDARADVLVALGRAATVAGDPRAVEHLEEALMAAGEPRRRAEIAYTTGRALGAGGRHREAAEIFDRGLTELVTASPAAGSADGSGSGPDEPDDELRLRLEAGFVGAARRDVATLPLAVARLRPILARGLEGSTPGQRALLAHVAYERALVGEPYDRVLAAATAALDGGRLLEEDTADGVAFHQAVSALAWADDLEGALGALAVAVADARRRGTAFGYAAAVHARAAVHHLAGNVEEALTDARVAMAAGREGWRLALPAAHAVAARALLERGELDAAEAALELPGGEERWEASVALAQLVEARSWLALARGDAESAASGFRDCRRRQTWVQAPNPADMAWRSGAALAAHALGDREKARSLAEQEVELARAYGAPRPLGIALRTCGLVLGGEAGLELLEAAVGVLDGSQARLELARARTELGAAQRRAGHRQAAQAQLRPALDLAHRCGAVALADRAREELAAAGARPRRPHLSGTESLTASERRVAELAAAGSTNREIAQALFVTVKTVEWHLRNTYLKLGIASRRELVGAMQAAA